MTAAEGRAAPPGALRRLSTFTFTRTWLVLAALLVPPLLWFAVGYYATLGALLVQSFYSVDDFSGVVVEELTLATYRLLVSEPSHLDIILRTVAMAAAVTAGCALLAFPLAYHAARYASPAEKGLIYLGVLLPTWLGYLVKVYAWRMVLAREGMTASLLRTLHLEGALEAVLGVPWIGGASLSASHLGTFIVFVSMWLPYMVLPLQAALERMPPGLLHAAADLGARPAQTLRHVVFPLAVPGLAAGAVFTFSLTLGDYIIPGLVGTPGYFIGMMVYVQQGTAGNVPLAAAFALVPIAIIAAFLLLMRRLGAFDAL